ncbi:MarR family winged helix-turn-helix transcriptional regulator [Agromyces seonyuensis]|uniref:MarR family transcriptional regulator n=1 Tax=Agromyces seonyuensis TaxID=2662446 RepID=A0A6I4NXF4_9MICO|nr:MarR family transcriptional regulator [Agromyces seonyuensis]MWB98871.1 MarR family transcriptional regulator [Agromyces seonyuensis]
MDDVELEEVAAALRVTTNRLARKLRSEGGLQEFTPSQTAAVRHLADVGEITVAELARLEDVRPQSMSATVAELERLGIVGRKADPADARARLVFLTDDAQSAILRARANKTRWFVQRMSERLDADEQRALAGVIPLLDRLLAP